MEKDLNLKTVFPGNWMLTSDALTVKPVNECTVYPPTLSVSALVRYKAKATQQL